jgi:flagellin
MASFINTNMVSLNTQNNLNKSQSALAQSIKRLSTGLRVNSAADDASGSAIANRMESAIRGQTVGVRNTNDAISYSQYAEGALNQIADNLQRMRELAVQSANGVNGQSERELLNTEFYQLQQENDRIRNNTFFNGMDALSGRSFTVQAGAGTSFYDKIEVKGMDLSKVTAVSATDKSTIKSKVTWTRAEFDKALAKVSADRREKLFFNESNGHVYELVTTGKTLAAATTGAAASTFDDQKGYLATITDATENTFVYNKTGGAWTWINGNDETKEGSFVYESTSGAPETGELTYKNFAGGEPNNLGNEDGVHLWGGGTWNDLNVGAQIWSVIEYGGTTTTSVSTATADLQVKVGGNWAWQVADGKSITIATGNTTYKDAGGNALTAGTVLNAGQVVYTSGTETGTATVANPDAANLRAVTQANSMAAASEASIYGNSSGVNILTQSDSMDAIQKLDAAIQQVHVGQIQQGATQNRLSAVVSVLTASTESLTNAKSHIVDTDYASETAKLARNQILQQAGIAMLAQANQLPNNIMSLLK